MIHPRALPRVFLPDADPAGAIEVPPDEWRKLTKVLRLSPGAEIAILPNDGTLVRCKLGNKFATPMEVLTPQTEPNCEVIVCQALPKGDKLDEIIRSCTSIGATRFEFFASDRTVVRWDAEKTSERLNRLNTIAMEACEVSYRTKLPEIVGAKSLEDVLKRYPDAQVLSEAEGEQKSLRKTERIVVVVGPQDARPQCYRVAFNQLRFFG